MKDTNPTLNIREPYCIFGLHCRLGLRTAFETSPEITDQKKNNPRTSEQIQITFYHSLKLQFYHSRFSLLFSFLFLSFSIFSDFEFSRSSIFQMKIHGRWIAAKKKHLACFEFSNPWPTDAPSGKSSFFLH